MVSTLKKLLFGVKSKSEIITAVGDEPHFGSSYFREWLPIFFSLSIVCWLIFVKSIVLRMPMARFSSVIEVSAMTFFVLPYSVALNSSKLKSAPPSHLRSVSLPTYETPLQQCAHVLIVRAFPPHTANHRAQGSWLQDVPGIRSKGARIAKGRPHRTEDRFLWCSPPFCTSCRYEC